MAQENTSTSNGLENQMRNMVLGNGTITSEQTNQGPQNPQSSQHRPGRGHGRGYGRGGVSHGFERNYQNYADQGQRWRANGPTNQSPMVAGRVYPSSQRYQPPQAGYSQNASPGDQSRHSGRMPPRSYNQRTTQTPTVLQRPSGNAMLPVQGQASSSLRSQASYPPQHNATQPREDPTAQIEHLDHLATQEIPGIEMSLAELEEKEAFRKHLERILQQAFAENYPGDIATHSLVGFGSLASGFGMPGSDMDLAVVTKWNDPSRSDVVEIDRSIPRLLGRAVLDAKLGGRLLTKTRVPILKICQNPTDALYAALCEDRKKWDGLPEEEGNPGDGPLKPSSKPKPLVKADGEKSAEPTQRANSSVIGEGFPELGSQSATKAQQKTRSKDEPMKSNAPTLAARPDEVNSNGTSNTAAKKQQPRAEKVWTRERAIGPLDFPKTGVGIQCDINFENPLGIHNTHMLRCYSLTDPRVRPIVLFVKAWAKRRKINSAYSGTLSSYGWVLMVVHYLVNIAQPPVCPNLQHSIPQPTDVAGLAKFMGTTVSGYSVRFWRNEQEITEAAQAGRLTQNTQSVGALLRGFFQYYAGTPAYFYGPRPPQFYWTNEVLSLRTQGGIQSKQSKGWVSATTKITAEKKVTNRYLFAIEDPFELDHNVARTVTHRGVVAIRDEIRRVGRILRAIGQGVQPEGGIFDEVFETVLSAPTLNPEEVGAPQKTTAEKVDGTGQAEEDSQQRVG
ncbi:PAP/OAS1 substrate-binding domain-containing protein [Cucurbitaria berberidis CBS 394.84]|uniref:polynucleotide adenylyltransferase n=1 Tax=Cucurbitaria berberidis CBS 394.84 TaxID=1168544 RepID=A0A9P4G9Z5_9PLEO|nr:PAP/OAS1 substrate-binding domain-containing protein [Cucurbitaria berberidis CBS 394.84]KAF1841903.1 PAP/OAS1 substrate-binding domain-containing protein [Cucurbitaria berberidis CBS 394.84]